MLKKTGIVAAAIAASFLAVTPLAFAGGKDPVKSESHKKDDKDKKKDKDEDKDKKKDKDKKDKDKDHKKDKDKDHKKKEDKDDDDDDDDDDTPPTTRPTTPPVAPPTKTVISDNNTNTCTFDEQGGSVTQSNSATGSALLGVTNLVAPVTAPVTTQLQALNCTNIDVSDVIDIDSNNPRTTVTSTDIDDSGNVG